MRGYFLTAGAEPSPTCLLHHEMSNLEQTVNNIAAFLGAVVDVAIITNIGISSCKQLQQQQQPTCNIVPRRSSLKSKACRQCNSRRCT
jgi:hypothetical protein